MLILDWKGPYRISDPEFYSQSLPGLYMFTVRQPDSGEFSLHYIGKTTMPLPNRLVGYGSTTGHLRDTVSGRYYLYDAAKLKRNIKESCYSLKDNFETFFLDLGKYLTLAREYLEAVDFFLCPFAQDEELIDAAESALIWAVFSNPERAQLFPILDNSNRVSSGIFGSGLILRNQLPKACIVTGLPAEVIVPANR